MRGLQSGFVLMFGVVLAACQTPPQTMTTQDAQVADVVTDTPDQLSPEVSTFVFQTAQSATLAMHVHSDEGAPLRGVVVTVREPAPSNGVLFQGATNAQGECLATYQLPTRFESVQVILVSPGWFGPYTDPELRTTHGAFAPGAWLQVDASSVSTLNIAFSRRSP